MSGWASVHGHAVCAASALGRAGMVGVVCWLGVVVVTLLPRCAARP